ncbi:uncharacterized protein EV420DRAFT_1678670 [Desarmillaria tabescens]|uniref:Uncharacterized protein n=1 Tax=Armillaria tabescens TaxID=1929756 RepID=A0AA39KCN0_ARMTA|nr:uncharacterized protein EV420DRAFT_1678670 [Desarmillaria tabescens]KAK0458722.1 hypothetical protein EV420DRAFT_1678670 [Desarmillaria tabescens]
MARKSTPQPLDAPRKKPGPKPWATPDQWDHLEGGIPGYRCAQGTKGKKAAIDNFIEDFMPTWWEKFPLEGDRTAEGDRKRIKQWFQNHGSIKKAATGIHIRDIFPKQRSRALKPVELYSHKYYKSRVKPFVDEKKKGATTQGEVLNIVKETTREMFVSEPEEIRQEILTEAKEQPPLVPAKDGIMTPEMYAAAIKVAPGQIKLFTKALADATGCGVLLIFGGPDPWEPRGKIATYGFHAGEDQQGRTFGQVFPKFRETYLSPFTRFLKTVFPPDVRAARVLGGNTTITQNSEGGVQGSEDIDVDNDAGAAAEKEEGIRRNELPPSEGGQIDAGESPSNAEKQPEEPNPEDNNRSGQTGMAVHDVPSAPSTPTQSSPLPASPTNSVGISPILQVPASPRSELPDSNPTGTISKDIAPPASPTNSGEGSPISQAPASLHSEALGLDLTGVIAKDVADKPVMQVEGSNESNPVNCTVKRPRSWPSHAPVLDGLVTTREKRARTGPAPKEILTLAERVRRGNGLGGMEKEVTVAPKSKRGRGRKNVLA